MCYFTPQVSAHRIIAYTPPGNIHARHVFSKADSRFRHLIEEAIIDINHPIYLTWWGQGHQANDRQYRAMWYEFFRGRTNATKEEILQKGREIMSHFNQEVLY